MSTTQNTTCYYHGDECMDGFAAAWTVYEYFRLNDKPTPKFVPVNYHTVLTGYPTGVVVLVDFIFTDLAVMRQLIDTATSVMVIDHHPQARDIIDTLQNEYPTNKFVGFWDEHRSGAGYTWDLLMSTPRPALINHIEDRDLWRFKLPNTEDFCNGLRQRPQTFTTLARSSREENYFGIIAEGEQYRERIDQVWEHHWHQLNGDYQEIPTLTLGEHEIPVMQIHRPELRSELAQRFIDQLKVPIVALVWAVGEHTRVRLVSTADGPDVNVLAKKWGGGGHPHASGLMFNNMTPEELLR